MDYKAYALMAILLASVASVALVGTANAQTTELTVETDADSYETGDTITVTGQLTATNINTSILLRVYDPEDNLVRTDQIEQGDIVNGSYSNPIPTGESPPGLMLLSGTYRVVVNYKSTDAETTFEFVNTGEGVPPFRTIQASIGGQNYPIQYRITGSGNSLDSITGDVTAISLLAALSTQSNGTLTLRFPASTFDADTEFVVFADGVSSDNLPAGSATTNEINIDFETGTEEIEIIGDFIIPEFGAIAAIVLAVAIVGIIVATARYSKLNFTQRL
jgi:predicted secreted protein with PEFG-CTERM motif